MKPFKTHKGILAPLDRANIDTDAIIPKQFLKSIARTGFGVSLFFDWRYLPDGKTDPAFVLNKPVYKGASILVARNNFGCGSSREHAVWAIAQYGFKAVIAPTFADIFKNNCVKNAVLTIELPEMDVEKIFQTLNAKPGTEASIDLEKQTLTINSDKALVFNFQVDPTTKDRLLNGLDDIGISLKYAEQITVFEKAHNAQLPA